MTEHEYDEEASERLHMDVVHEVDDPGLMTTSRWVESRRRLNTITDRLARDVLALHEDCGTGTGPCDSDDDDALEEWEPDWGCETTRVIADHYGIEFPAAEA